MPQWSVDQRIYVSLWMESGKRKAILTQDFHAFSGPLKIVVPNGFITDFASIPWGIRAFVHVFEEHMRGAVIHDWLYYNGTVTRKQADQTFYHVMRSTGVSWHRARAMFSGVRVGGWAAWNNHRKRERDAVDDSATDTHS